MGLEKDHGGGDKILALQRDAEGRLRFDELARIGHDKDKVIYQ